MSETKPKRPDVVCLCGSTRFYTTFQEANYRSTMEGKIVLSVGFYPHAQDEAHGGDVGVTPEQKDALDRLHFRKIDMADEVLVLNVGGYIGESTANEIAYAFSQAVPVRFWERDAGEAWLERNSHALGRRIARQMEGGLGHE